MLERQMDGCEPIEQAKKALSHLIRVMGENPHLAYYLGPGSQSFSLVTEAAATLFGQTVEQVRERAINPHAAEPRAGISELIEACERVVRENRERDGEISIGAVEDCEQAVKIAKGEDL